MREFRDGSAVPLAAYVPGDDSKILFVASSCDMITFSSPASLTSYRTSYKALYIKNTGNR